MGMIECPVILVATVGTGGPNNPVWDALVFSVTHHKPEHVYWLCSKKTAEETLPKVKLKIRIPEGKQTTIESKDIDNIEKCYLEYLALFDKIRERFKVAFIVADFTSGTKAMSAALSLAATARKVNILAYMTGKRDSSGRCIYTDRAISFHPELIYAEGNLSDAIGFLNHGDFTVAFDLAERTRQAAYRKTDQLAETALIVRDLAEAYHCWDLFQYQKVLNLLDGVLKRNVLRRSICNVLQRQHDFLEVCVNGVAEEELKPQWAPQRMADMLANAKRRFERRNYDDCVVRCYRLLEYTVQRQLWVKYRIASRQGLVCGYQRLVEQKDEVGQSFERNYVGNGTWYDPKGPLAIVSARHDLLLIHGLRYCGRQVAEDAMSRTERWVKQWFADFGTLVETAAFPTFDRSCFNL